MRYLVLIMLTLIECWCWLEKLKCLYPESLHFTFLHNKFMSRHRTIIWQTDFLNERRMTHAFIVKDKNSVCDLFVYFPIWHKVVQWVIKVYTGVFLLILFLPSCSRGLRELFYNMDKHSRLLRESPENLLAQPSWSSLEPFGWKRDNCLNNKQIYLLTLLCRWYFL